MRIKILASALLVATFVLPVTARAQDGAGPSNWANAGGTDPARDLVGLGVRVFDRGHSGYAAGSAYSAQALYEPRTAVSRTPKKK